MTARPRRGVNAIEFALVAPLVLVLTFAVMDYAWFFVGYQEVQHLAREATRVGAQTTLDDDPAEAALAYVEEASKRGLALSGFDLLATADVVDESAIEVFVTATYEPLIGIVPMPSELRGGARLPLEAL